MSDPYTDATPRLALPYLAAGQAHKHLTLNEAMARLDALVGASAVSRTVAVQPSSPAEGDLYLLPAAASGGDWSGRASGAPMRWDAGAWVEVTVAEGVLVHVRDENRLWLRTADGWTPLDALARELGELTRLGIGTAADEANPLSAKLNAALFTARGGAEGGDGSLRLALNKETTADVLSLLFQTGYGGRAELGLLGDDRLSLKVSGDGATWQEALGVDPATGAVTFARGVGRSELHVLTADGAYTPPVWARRLEITALGGGGGGGAGASGTGARFGGGGGAAGAAAFETFEVGDLAGPLMVTLGAGGPGGVGGVAAVGGGGTPGGATTVSDAAGVLLSAAGGGGGAGGSATAGPGGASAVGWPAPSAAGGNSATVTAGVAGGASGRFGGAGGGGGGLDAAGAQRSGGAGGVGYAQGGLVRRSPGGAGGIVGGEGAAGSAKRFERACGAGGGGGAAAAAGAGGGAGGWPSGGGGGGGASRETSAGGAGGVGARGEVWILALG